MVVEVSHLESLLPLRLAAFYSGQITTAFKLRCILVKTPYRVHAPAFIILYFGTSQSIDAHTLIHFMPVGRADARHFMADAVVYHCRP